MDRLKPFGHRVIVIPDEVEETTESGIYIVSDLEAEQQAQCKGVVLAVGPTAFKDLGCKVIHSKYGDVTVVEHAGDPWCKVGDKVYYQRHAGMRIPDENGKLRKDILMLNDQDITAGVVEEDPKEEK